MADLSRSGANNSNWKGGRIVEPRGYVLIRVGVGHPLADVRGYAYEHRLIAEKKLRRKLRKGEEIHHTKRTGDNAPADLVVTKNRAAHAVYHRKRSDLRLPGQRNPVISCECGCGARFKRYDADNRPRRFIAGHNFRR